MLDDVTRKMGGAFLSTADLDKIESEVKRLREQRDALLEALEGLYAKTKNDHQRMGLNTAAHAAIAKAKGESHE